MWIRWIVCARRHVVTLSAPRLRQAAPPCCQRQRHSDAEDATSAIIGSMAVKLDGFRLLISSLLLSSEPSPPCSFHICCFSASTRFCFPPSSRLIRPICSPTPPTGRHFYTPAAPGVAADECLHDGDCMNSSCSLCKGVTPPPPPSNLSLIATCISNSEPRLLNLESVWFSTSEVVFYSWLLESATNLRVTLSLGFCQCLLQSHSSG